MTTDAPIWTGHPSHWRYFWSWVLGILLLPVVVGIFIILWIFLDRSRRTYLVTPTRVISESGLWVKSSDEVRIQDIRSIAVQKSGLKGALGVGDIEFSSAAAAEAEIVFASVPKADEIRDLVRKYQVAD